MKIEIVKELSLNIKFAVKIFKLIYNFLILKVHFFEHYMIVNDLNGFNEEEFEEVGATKIKDGIFIGDDFSSSVSFLNFRIIF